MPEKLLPIKILYTGLDNAGKSSIILTLLRDKEHIDSVLPTRGVRRRDYNFLGMEISEWELGGQRLYRKQYLTHQADKIFLGTEIVIFIIDIQDPERYDESLEYLQQIIEQLDRLSLKPPIYVFFHKYDPVSLIGSQHEINNNSLELRNRIKQFNYDNFKFFRTSIYNIQSIILAVSHILLSKNPKTTVIEKAIQDFANRMDLLSLVLIDDNSLLLGYYYFNKYIEQLMNAVTPFFLEVNELFERVDLRKTFGSEDEKDDEMLIRRFGKYFFFKKFELKKEGAYFYFLGCKNDPNFVSEDFNMFVNVVKEIL
ncbi:MAG: ADP-ribosylation factor-like protein [Promethearchaeia archaeon]